MLKSLLKSLAIFGDSFFWKIIFLSMLISLSILTIFWYGIGYILIDIEFNSWWLSWLDWTMDGLVTWLGPIVAIALSYFLFPITFPLITLIFLNPIVLYLEKKYYPESTSTINAPTFMQSLPSTIKFTLTALVLNIVALPFYLIPVVNVVVYFSLNGYLFGREYYEMISLRYLSVQDMKKVRLENAIKIMKAGLVITGIFITPFLNIVAPIVATVLMVHLYHITLNKQLMITNK